MNNSVSLNVQWLGPDMAILTPTEATQVSSGVYISNLTLNPLHLEKYSCSVSYCLGGISSDDVRDEVLFIADDENMTIISELLYLIFACL